MQKLDCEEQVFDSDSTFEYYYLKKVVSYQIYTREEEVCNFGWEINRTDQIDKIEEVSIVV